MFQVCVVCGVLEVAIVTSTRPNQVYTLAKCDRAQYPSLTE